MTNYDPDIHHRRSIRLKEYDYSWEGFYFLTICVQVGANGIRPHLFGRVADGEMVLNDAGKIAHDEWVKTTEIRPNVNMGVFVIMPNHIHGIINITEPDDGRGVLHTPEHDLLQTPVHVHQGVCNTQKNGAFVHDHQGVCNTQQSGAPVHFQEGVCNTPLQSPSNTVGAIVRGYKSAVTKRLGSPIWQRNYYEHVIRNAESHESIARYIVNNPMNWAIDKFYCGGVLHTPKKRDRQTA